MQIKSGTPKFTPLIIQLEDKEEIKFMQCVMDFVTHQGGAFQKLCELFSDKYQKGEDIFCSNDFAHFLTSIENATGEKLKEKK